MDDGNDIVVECVYVHVIFTKQVCWSASNNISML